MSLIKFNLTRVSKINLKFQLWGQIFENIYFKLSRTDIEYVKCRFSIKNKSEIISI